MRLLLLLTILASSALASSSMDMCKRCHCEGGTINCANKRLGDHFNDTVWKGIISVDEFNMDHNEIAHLRTFPSFGTRKISIRHNILTKIDDGAFRYVTNLTEIDLSYNHLTSQSLTPHVFRGNYSPEKYEPLIDVKILRLSGNIIHSLKNDVFEHLPNLRVLQLDANPFKTIDLSTSMAIASVYYLEVLDLSSTMLSSFPPNVLHTPKFLKVLNFSSNHFTEIPHALQETHSLEEFIISDNIIQTLKYFPPVPTLKVLKMNWMPVLRSIESRALSNLTGLEELHCSYNRHLAFIAEDILMHSPEGEEEGNTWPPIRKLYLSNNDLSYLDFNLLSRWDNVVQLDIQMNPWTCECSNQWMLTSLIPVVNRTNSSLTRGIICHSPPEMEHASLLELSEKKYRMRCLDMYGHQPERDARLLVSIFVCVLILIPIAMAAILILSYRLHRQSSSAKNFSYRQIILNSASD